MVDSTPMDREIRSESAADGFISQTKNTGGEYVGFRIRWGRHNHPVSWLQPLWSYATFLIILNNGSYDGLDCCYRVMTVRSGFNDNATITD